MEALLLIADVVALFLLLIWNVKNDNRPDGSSPNGLFSYKEDRVQDSPAK